MGTQRRLFTEIDGGGFSFRKPDYHETSTTDVACRRMGDCEGEAAGNGGIYRVAAGPENGAANLARAPLRRHDHAVLGANRRGRNDRDEFNLNPCRARSCMTASRDRGDCHDANKARRDD